MQYFFPTLYELTIKPNWLFGVELDNQLFLHRQSKVFANRETFNFALEILFFNGNPLWQSSSNDSIQGIDDGLDFFAFLRHLDRVPNLYQKGWDIDTVSVDQKMVVPDKMSPLCSGVCKAETINHIIKPTFEKHQQIGSGNALFTVRFFKKQTKLLFRKTVGVLNFLLFAELDTIVRGFSAPTLPMLTGSITSPVKGAFIGITAVSL
jgi:hypothetical protein